MMGAPPLMLTLSPLKTPASVPDRLALVDAS